MAGKQRDPVSELFDPGARQLLERAYAKPGAWTGTRVAFPSPRQVAYFGGMGITVLGADQWGRDRWAAGFIRAVYYQHRWFYAQGRLRAQRRTTANDSRAVRYEIGRRMPVLGVIPAGRAVRVMVQPGGQQALKAVRRLPDSRRIYDDGGDPAARWADPALRDW
jgi:hypothetical protein